LRHIDPQIGFRAAKTPSGQEHVSQSPGRDPMNSGYSSRQATAAPCPAALASCSAATL
jgi:hypothetical protein